MKWDAHLNSALRIVNQYDGGVPLAAWLKQFFREHKQMGARDRRSVSALVYAYYRMGLAMPAADKEAKMLTGLFLCATEADERLRYFRPEWDAAAAEGLERKIELLGDAFQLRGIFPWQDALSEGVDHGDYCRSFLVQPKLFVRIRPGKHKKVLLQLQSAGISFEQRSEDCLAFDNGTKLESVLAIDESVIIQDESSQKTGLFLGDEAKPLRVWDCCAASGGKSIMAYDRNPAVQLYVSDVRQSMLHNLQQRFAKAGIQNYLSSVTDLSAGGLQSSAILQTNFQPDLIIADVPCTGSGTWSRTPEQLYFFKEEKINEYADRQRAILRNVTPQLKRGGQLVYITCSVFREENEAMVAFIEEELKLKLTASQLIAGYARQADSMFVAVFSS
jgi:16S rRNA (cytosine967-C5)-methyltransferase